MIGLATVYSADYDLEVPEIIAKGLTIWMRSSDKSLLGHLSDFKFDYAGKYKKKNHDNDVQVHAKELKEDSS